ncbi:hypothetical protein EDD15DRAFT_2383680 [Pisolithus albus]|nr:hypothetical protein EDD15DRAFT_2383680 [Pisolithus albus]
MDPTIQLELPLSQVTLLLSAAQLLPPSPESYSLVRLLEDVVTQAGSQFPSSPSHHPALPADSEDDIDRELLALAGFDDCAPSCEAPKKRGHNSCSRNGTHLQKRRKVKGGLVPFNDKGSRTRSGFETQGDEQRWEHVLQAAPCGNHSALSFLALLAGASADRVSTAVEEFKSFLCNTKHVQGSSLDAVVQSCQHYVGNNIASNFLLMLSYIQLAVKCQSEMDGSSALSSIHQLYKEKIQNLPVKPQPSRTSFYRWHAVGHKFAQLARGGSLYILFLIAALDLRWAASKLQAQVPWDIGKMLRQPSTCSNSSLITDNIITTVAHLRRLLPFRLSVDMFCSNFIRSSGLPMTDLDGTDLEAMDQLLGALRTENFALPERDKKAWLTCLNPVDERERIILPGCEGLVSTVASWPSSSGVRNEGMAPSSAHCSSAFTSIKTAFDPSHEKNKEHFNHRRAKESNFLWTDRERHLAEQAPVALDIYELQDQLCSFYPEGIKKAGSYIHVPVRDMPQQSFEIQNIDGSLMVFVSSAMPAQLKNRLLQSFLAAFDGGPVLDDRDTANEGRQPFPCVHYAIYNRYGVSGMDAPTNYHPHYLQLKGKQTNHTQMVPYMSAETFQHEERYHKLLGAFEGVFEWIETLLQNYLPQEYDILMELADAVPKGYSLQPHHSSLSQSI